MHSKMPRQSREATRAKANNRERRRMGKINTTLDSLRKILNLSSNTSQTVTLDKVLQTLKVLLPPRAGSETGESDVDEQTVFYEVLTPQTPMDQTNESETIDHPRRTILHGVICRNRTNDVNTVQSNTDSLSLFACMPHASPEQ
ncbi:uncharacterized protein LOC118506992 [Anopheles stephensi]|uniref:uncharacterized protein LOC118506992 n=1 Tax=Anopheles stephensi TaxID=30069 RepID=UPI00165898F6|nr:uncharacterized protein LOC118506992 [Anopheles stephensi]XP_035900763.1 uncharacterized protein LOC118506992 [Anopheles stephensi]XP_035900764.1 uncharacterized protein LOC118506992 [Anopheles stephensi]XP_035900765.1 uncharacterized protein LOC118506992 [Anopheles stephensi]